MLIAIFDFDGTLADTKNIHVAAWERTFGELGWEVSPEEAAQTGEIDDREFLRRFFAKRKLDEDKVNFEAWLERKCRVAVQILESSPRLHQGVADLVRALRGSKQTRLAVASTTNRQNIEIVLKANQLFEAFELIIAKEDVVEVKPSPECYLQALRRMKAKPKQAVAIEDSPTGLEAARAAGIRAVAVGHDRPQGDWSGDSAYLPHFRDLQAAMQAISP